MEVPVTGSSKMVHNGLIGGTPDSGERYGDFNSLYYSDRSSDAALLREIPSEDLITFDQINSSQDLMTYREMDSALPIGEFLESKFNLDTFPNLEEHDHAGLNFNIDLIPTNGGKGSWYYSSKLSKVFIRMDQTIYIQVEYFCRIIDVEPVLLRVMMVFRDDVGRPVKRCNNHKQPSITGHQNEAFIESVVRCENSGAQYQGTAAGKNVNDRLSVLVPLSAVQPDEKNVIKQSIALKFVCQNSCIGRRSTAIIFTLENKNGEVLGKRYISVKICSCPKRDKDKEENKKRPSEEANAPPGKKLKVAKIKEEPEDSKPETPLTETDDQITTNGDELCIEQLPMPDSEFRRAMYDYAFAQIAKRMALEPDNPKYLKYFKEYKSRLLGVTSDSSTS